MSAAAANNNNNHSDDDDDDDDDEKTTKKKKVTAHSYGALEGTEQANSESVWMIRVPPKLAQLWDEAPEGTELGELIFTKGGPPTTGGIKRGRGAPLKPSFSVHVSETLVQEMQKQEAAAAAPQDTTTTRALNNNSKPAPSIFNNLPLNYSLQAMTKKVPTMHPFTRNLNGSCQLMGQVSRTANLQVESQDSRYRSMLKDRLVSTSINSNRFVKPVEATESVMSKQRQQNAAVVAAAGASSNSNNNKTFGNAVYQFGKRLLEAQHDSHLQQQQQQQVTLSNKKARQFSPDQPIRSIVFELFGQSQYWTVKDLKAAAIAGGATHCNTKRSEAEIRDVLRAVGDYHRSGDHKNMWELRREFTNSQQQQQQQQQT